MKTGALSAAVLAVLSGGADGAAAREPAAGPLAEYVAKDGDGYGWVERGEGRLGAASYTELLLTSQTWRGIPWRHRLLVIKPSNLDPDAKAALLFIGGGAWRDGAPAADGRDGPPPRAPLLARVAEAIGAPVALLRHVPRQPLFDGLAEDALIALTFENYLRTGDPEWPLLLPMVKSAVRAMDAVQEYAAQAWGLDIESFTVAGESKRGWTTWLAAAVDDRVTALAPMVFDVLDIGKQLAHQTASWGAPSHMLGDYTGRGLHEQLDTPAGQALLDIVDPYAYRGRLSQPKLIVLGTNDPYWPLDALNLYRDDLPGRNHVLYVPNAGHSIDDPRRLVGGLAALHRHAAGEAPLPDLRWRFDQGGDRLRLRVDSDVEPEEVVAWVAHAPTRDFRDAAWSPRPCGREDGAHACRLPIPEAGYAALFAEAAYDPGGAAPPYFLSTTVGIVGADKPPAPR